MNNGVVFFVGFFWLIDFYNENFPNMYNLSMNYDLFNITKADLKTKEQLSQNFNFGPVDTETRRVYFYSKSFVLKNVSTLVHTAPLKTL